MHWRVNTSAWNDLYHCFLSREENQAFRETMAELEKHSCVRGLSFTSFLILPFQRITRLKLLVQVQASPSNIKSFYLNLEKTLVHWESSSTSACLCRTSWRQQRNTQKGRQMPSKPINSWSRWVALKGFRDSFFGRMKLWIILFNKTIWHVLNYGGSCCWTNRRNSLGGEEILDWL